MEVKNIQNYDKNFFNEINYKWGILCAGDKNTGCNGMTVSWGGSGVIWNKNVAFLFVRKSRYTYEFLKKSHSLSLSFLSDDYKDAKVFFGRKSGRDFNKFKETGLTPVYDEETDSFYIKESDTSFLLKEIYHTDIPFEGMPEDIEKKFYPDHDMHTMFVCEIVKYLDK